MRLEAFRFFPSSLWLLSKNIRCLLKFESLAAGLQCQEDILRCVDSGTIKL